GGEVLIAATSEGRALLCKAEEVNFLAGPGKGVMLIKLGKEDRVLGAIASSGDRDLLTVETTRGAEQTISTAKYGVTGRGGKGRELLQRGGFAKVVWPMPETPAPLARASSAGQGGTGRKAGTAGTFPCRIITPLRPGTASSTAANFWPAPAGR